MENILKKETKEICQDILKQINNDSVKIEVDDSSKTSLYVFLTNTIFISNKKIKTKKSINEQNKSRILVIAHECAHSNQHKIMQFANFIVSNLEILIFLTLLFLACVLKYTNPILTYVYVATFMSNIIVRLYLEMDATIKSVKIVAKYLLGNGVQKRKVRDLVYYYKKELLKALPLFIFSLFITKIARLIIVLLI